MQPSEVYVMSVGSEPSVQQKPKLLDRVRAAIRSRHYSPRTEEAYVARIRRYVFFHCNRRRHHLHESVSRASAESG
jgi:hypothetical protein